MRSTALHVREFEARDVEQFGHLLDRRCAPGPCMSTPSSAARTWISRNTRSRSGPMRAGIGEVVHGGFEVELGTLAAREMRDGRVDLRAVEPQLRHDLARRGDLRLRHAAVGLGDVAHDFERRLEEAHADLERVGAACRGGRAATL